NRDQNYAMLWQGYITIPADGTYTFETSSDDGSKLYLGEYSPGATALVNNDGQHSVVSQTGSIYLTAGVYPFTVSYLQSCCAGSIDVYWSSSSGIVRQPIPDDAFSFSSPATVNQISTGLDYSYYEGTWSYLPDFSTLTPNKTGTSSNVTLGIRNRDQNYSVLWQGYITIPATGTYTFETNSDDGSKLYLSQYSYAATALVNNDGNHGFQLVSDSIHLNAGVYPIAIAYLQSCCAGTLEVYWSSNTGINRQRIPDGAFSHVESGGVTSAINYYFSSSTGNDAYTSAQARNPATPWKTLSKLNSVLDTVAAGSAMLLKRGDIFEGSLVFRSSGASGNPIIISAYDTGRKPVITGLTSPASWFYRGNGVWRASLPPNNIARLNMVVQNGRIQAMGRYPNITAANKGYLTFNSHSGSATITDNNHSPDPNWANGAELVVRKNEWVIDRGPITSVSGNSITFSNPTGFGLIDGYGYFIQNDSTLLDQLGEWYFNKAQNVVQVYTGSAASPADYGFRFSVVDTLVTIHGKSNITFDNISLQGANQSAMAVWDGANNVSVQNCLISFSGHNAIAGNFTQNFVLNRSVVSHTNNNGLYLAPYCLNTVIKNNLITNTGLIPGLGANDNQALEGMTIDGTGSLIQYNTVDSTGYIGIAFTNDSVSAVNNFVNHFALTTDDGAGIYTHDGVKLGRKILGNIILNGKGSHEGTFNSEDSDANGIGTDDRSTYVQIYGNTIANCNGRGIGLHNSQYIALRGNTLFNNKLAQIQLDHDVIATDSPTRYDSIFSNIVFAKTASQYLFGIRSLTNDISQSGLIDSNYYYRPDNNELAYYSYIDQTGETTLYNFPHWKSILNFDAHSTEFPSHFAAYTINSTDTNRYKNSTFNADISKVVNFASSVNQIDHDPNALDGGALKVTYTGTTTTGFNAIWFYDNGSDPHINAKVLAGHTYRVKFSAIASVDNNINFYADLRTAIGDSIHPQTDTGVTAAKIFKVSNVRSEVELLFTPTKNIPYAFFSINTTNSPQSAGGCPTYWIDNLVFEEVTSITYTNPDDYIRFVYNADSSSVTVPLDQEYTDIKSNVYPYSITLAPYSSAVLIQTLALSQSQTKTPVPMLMKLMQEPGVQPGLSLSPNPATSRIRITYSNQAVTQRRGVVTIHGSNGGIVKHMTLNPQAQYVDLSVADLAPGVYIMRVDFGNRIEVRRFVKL
ncbi:MAG: right-handed parallel beta-helix repeat-containing protein, partial [Williamsia sp.]|nr:right-handed parallel beta-helix repeat-containing protein [Williamsia sp.]